MTVPDRRVVARVSLVQPSVLRVGLPGRGWCRRRICNGLLLLLNSLVRGDAGRTGTWLTRRSLMPVYVRQTDHWFTLVRTGTFDPVKTCAGAAMQTGTGAAMSVAFC